MITSVNNSAMTAASYDCYRTGIFYPKTDSIFDPAVCANLKNTRTHDVMLCIPWVETICSHVFSLLPTTIEPVTSGGTFHLIFHVVVNGRDFIIRLNRLPDYHKAYGFLLEADLYAKLVTHEVPTPQIISVDISRTIVPTDYQVLTYIQGLTLSAYQDPETQYMHPQLLKTIGMLVALVHRIRGVGCGPLSVQTLNGLHGTWQTYIFLNLHEHISYCEKLGAISAYQASLINHLFLTHQSLFVCDVPVLLHGDLGNHNFLSHDGATIAGLIDWEDCMYGDPVFDIAFWGTFFKDYMLAHFLQGYLSVSGKQNNFYLRYWLYYLRIALSKTVHRNLFGYQDHPTRPKPSLRIQNALSHLV